MSGEGFLSRWSRLKRGGGEREEREERSAAQPPEAPATGPGSAAAPPQAPAEATAPAPARAVGDEPNAHAPEGPAEGEEEAFDLSSLPPIESLTAESDIGAFLRRGVPQALRNAALRRMWTLDPQIRSFIGPADYAWDFNAPDAIPGFASTLGGDVGKLLSQAIGLDSSPGQEGKPKDRADAAPVQVAGPVPQSSPQDEAPFPEGGEGAAEEVAGADAAEEAASQPVPEVPAGIEEASAMPRKTAEEVAPTPPPRRRHGGAVPV